METESPSQAESVLKVFFFSDIVGSTELKQRLGDTAGAVAIDKHDSVFRICMRRHRGFEEENTGDGFFATFDRPSDALRCALEFQRELGKLDVPEPLKVRIGIHLGEVARLPAEGNTDGAPKLVGLAVDTSARLMSLAQGGQILLSRPAFDSARQQLDLRDEDGEIQCLAHGGYLFKGINMTVEVFEVGIRGLSPLAPPADSEKAISAVTLGDEVTLGWRPAVGLQIPGREGWVLQRKLSEGEHGEVWVARQERTKDVHAFKFCFDPEHLKRLKRQLTLFRLLNETLGARPDIARLYDVKLSEAPYYLEVDYSAQGHLAEWARDQTDPASIPLETRLRIVAQVAEAMAAAHSAKILHRAINPENILIVEARDGTIQAKLTGFDLSSLTDVENAMAEGITIAGFTETISSASLRGGAGESARLYLAPEVVAGSPPTAQSDIYSLGVILYQMAIGDLTRPLGQGWEREIEDELLRSDIDSCVQGDPAARIQDVKLLAERLNEYKKRRAELQWRKAAEQRLRSKRSARRKMAVALMGIAIVGLLIAVATLMMMRP